MQLPFPHLVLLLHFFAHFFLLFLCNSAELCSQACCEPFAGGDGERPSGCDLGSSDVVFSYDGQPTPSTWIPGYQPPWTPPGVCPTGFLEHSFSTSGALSDEIRADSRETSRDAREPENVKSFTDASADDVEDARAVVQMMLGGTSAQEAMVDSECGQMRRIFELWTLHGHHIMP